LCHRRWWVPCPAVVIAEGALVVVAVGASPLSSSSLVPCPAVLAVGASWSVVAVGARSFSWPRVPPPVVLMAVWCTPGRRCRVGAPTRPCRRGSLPLVLKAVGAPSLVLVWCPARPRGHWCPPARPRRRGCPPPVVLAVQDDDRVVHPRSSLWPCPTGHPRGAPVVVIAVGVPRSSLWSCSTPPWSSSLPHSPSWPSVPARSSLSSWVVLAVWCPAPARRRGHVVPSRWSFCGGDGGDGDEADEQSKRRYILY
jgi:hypothetical protein